MGNLQKEAGFFDGLARLLVRGKDKVDDFAQVVTSPVKSWKDLVGKARADLVAEKLKAKAQASPYSIFSNADKTVDLARSERLKNLQSKYDSHGGILNYLKLKGEGLKQNTADAMVFAEAAKANAERLNQKAELLKNPYLSESAKKAIADSIVSGSVPSAVDSAKKIAPMAAGAAGAAGAVGLGTLGGVGYLASKDSADGKGVLGNAAMLGSAGATGTMGLGTLAAALSRSPKAATVGAGATLGLGALTTMLASPKMSDGAIEEAREKTASKELFFRLKK